MTMKKITLILFLLFFCFNSYAQFPEGFEGESFPPAGWVSFIGENGLGTVQNWTTTNISNTGSNAAYNRYENVSGGLAQDWLVTPQFTPGPLVGSTLRFFQRQSYTTDYGSTYYVYVSTGSQETIADFVQIDAQTEADFTYIYTMKEIDLSAYNGTPIYVAFVMENDDGDNWLIDDVDLVVPPSAVPSCATNFTNTVDATCGNEDFSVSWDAVDDAAGYLFTAGTTSGGNDLADAVDLVLSTSYSFTGVADQTYYFTVTPYNAAGNAEACEEQSVTTASLICTPCDSAIALTPGIEQSGDTADFGDLSDDSTCLNFYDNGDDAIYSYVATEDNETMTVTVDFTATYGGVSMSLGCPSGDSSAYTCVGAIGNSSTGEKSFTSEFLVAGETYYIHISTYASPQSTAYTLDTVVIPPPSCYDPTALEVSNVTTDSADISWTSDDTNFNIEVVDVTAGGTATGTATYSGVTSPYALTGLLDNNQYEVYVQNDCGADLSEWVSTGFTTLALPTVPDYTNDFSTFPGDLWSEAEGTIADGPSGSFAGWSGFSSSYARINLYNTGDIDWLISPEFDLSAQAYFLNLDVSVTAYSGGGEISMGSDDLVSLVMTTDGTTWTILKQWSAADNLGNDFVAMDEILLGTSSSARFALHADEGTVDDAEDYYFNVDNFSITSSSILGINDLETTQFTYFPNPVNDQLIINAQASVNDIAVFNMLGQVVLRQSPNSSNCMVDMAALRTGVYFVQVSIGNNTQTVRVLKQ